MNKFLSNVSEMFSSVEKKEPGEEISFNAADGKILIGSEPAKSEYTEQGENADRKIKLEGLPENQLSRGSVLMWVDPESKRLAVQNVGNNEVFAFCTDQIDSAAIPIRKNGKPSQALLDGKVGSHFNIDIITADYTRIRLKLTGIGSGDMGESRTYRYEVNPTDTVEEARVLMDSVTRFRYPKEVIRPKAK